MPPIPIAMVRSPSPPNKTTTDQRKMVQAAAADDQILIPRFPSSVHRLCVDGVGVPDVRSTVWPIHDLVINEILQYLLPTHRRTLLFKFLVVAAIDVYLAYVSFGSFWQQLVDDEDDDDDFTTGAAGVLIWLDHCPHTATPRLVVLLRRVLPMFIVFAAAMLFFCYWCWYYRRVWSELIVVWTNGGGKKDGLLVFPTNNTCWWMDPAVTERMRLPMHVPMRHYATEDQARKGACSSCVMGVDAAETAGPNVWCLDPMAWKFSLQPTVQQGLAVATQQSAAAATITTTAISWRDNMKVPAHWTMVDGVNDRPIYTNQKYPFPCQPPLVPYDNPTGVYKLAGFDVPAHWQDMDSFHTSSFTILSHGIESAAYVFCNDRLVGFTKDSRLPAEFDVTSALRPLNNTIYIVVIRWSDGSYLEDQDHWWMAGT
jgi:Glycosyl hydrolases family 2, sugar binding domain